MPNETVFRLSSFLGIILIMVTWELIFPRRKLKHQRIVRWYSNLGIIFISSLLIKILFPLTAVSVAFYVQNTGWGVLNVLALPFFVKIIIAVIILDFTIYWQHVLFHKLPLLWKLHKMHHTDLDFDFSTALRFHPVEIIASMLIKLGVIIALGAPPVSVLIFEIVLNGMALFNHSNVFVPLKIDRYLRLLFVTPDMHRVHHSVIVKETNSNYGFNLPWWDRIFKTYTAQPQEGHEKMLIGLQKFRNPKYLNLHWLLIIPFIKDRD